MKNELRRCGKCAPTRTELILKGCSGARSIILIYLDYPPLEKRKKKIMSPYPMELH